MWKWFFQLGSPPYVYRLAGWFIPWLGILGAGLIVYACWQGLFVAPPDYQQKDAFRIIYVHVPAAYLSMMAYTIMGIASAIGLIWRMKLSHALAESAAPIGASFTALALATGSVWGRPMWGTWWEWGDPRLTSELVLLFLYVGYMVLRNAIGDANKADRAVAVLAIVGLVNIPIIHYSVEWWSSLHQGATLVREGGPSMPKSMLIPLLLSILGFTLFFGCLLLMRLRAVIVRRERRSRWLTALLDGQRSPRWIRPLWTLFSTVALVSTVFLVYALANPGELAALAAFESTMSGYGLYVFTCFYLAALVLVGNALAARAAEIRDRRNVNRPANASEVTT